MRQIRRTSTSGNDNNCSVNALATYFLVLLHADTISHAHEQAFLKQKIQDGAFDKLKDHILDGQTPILDARVQISQLGKALRKYGASLMMEDVRGERLHSDGLEQALLAAFEDYCSNADKNDKSAENLNDDTFSGMNFVQEKFKSLYSDGADGRKTFVEKNFKSLYSDLNLNEKDSNEKKQSLEEERWSQKNQEIEAWWRAPYVDTENTESKNSLGGYQSYVMELAKDGVELSLQFVDIIARSLGFNVLYDNQADACGKLRSASDQVDGPSIILYRSVISDRGRSRGHWEVFLDPALVENFNKKLDSNVASLSQMGSKIRDTTYLNFLTGDEQKEFENKLATDVSEDDAHIKFGRALAQSYGLKDQTAIYSFADAYKKQICNGQGMITAVARSLEKQNFNVIQLEGKPHALNADDFVEGFCKGSCNQEVSRYDVPEFAKRYAFFKDYFSKRSDVKSGKTTAQQVATENTFKWIQKQNQAWRTDIKNHIRTILSKDVFGNQVNADEVKVVSPKQVSRDEVIFDVTLKNKLVLRRSQGAMGQLEVSTKGSETAKMPPEKIYEAIGNLIILDRCDKFGQTRETLTEEQRTIVLDFVNPPSMVKECRRGFLKAGMKVEFVGPLAKATQGSNFACKQGAPENVSTPKQTATENPKTCREEGPVDPPVPPRRMGMAY